MELDEPCGNIARGDGLAGNGGTPVLSWDGSLEIPRWWFGVGRASQKCRCVMQRWRETGEKEGEGGRGKLAGEEAI